jgi:protein subunit release factor A
MRELHLTKKDFSIEWFSGTGKGGQNRNKRQNCCRIVHLATGLRAVGQNGRDRVENQRTAFKTLCARLVAYYQALDDQPPEISKEVVRNYHAERNEVLDKASGLRRPYKDVVLDGELGEMIEARKSAMEQKIACSTDQEGAE